jgi:hypothetical protein
MDKNLLQNVDTCKRLKGQLREMFFGLIKLVCKVGREDLKIFSHIVRLFTEIC